jgi:hypothetical protein
LIQRSVRYTVVEVDETSIRARGEHGREIRIKREVLSLALAVGEEFDVVLSYDGCDVTMSVESALTLLAGRGIDVVPAGGKFR